MAILTYDSNVVYDTASYTYDGVLLAGGSFLDLLLAPRRQPRLTDRDIDDPEPRGYLTKGWHRRRGDLV